MTNEDLTKKVIELDERTIKHGEQLKSCFSKIEDVTKLTDSVSKMATSLEVLATEQKSTKAKVSELGKDIEEIKEKPAKHWDNTVRLIFELVLTAVVTLVLIKIGIN